MADIDEMLNRIYEDNPTNESNQVATESGTDSLKNNDFNKGLGSLIGGGERSKRLKPSQSKETVPNDDLEFETFSIDIEKEPTKKAPSMATKEKIKRSPDAIAKQVMKEVNQAQETEQKKRAQPSPVKKNVNTVKEKQAIKVPKQPESKPVEDKSTDRSLDEDNKEKIAPEPIPQEKKSVSSSASTVSRPKPAINPEMPSQAPTNIADKTTVPSILQNLMNTYQQLEDDLKQSQLVFTPLMKELTLIDQKRHQAESQLNELLNKKSNIDNPLPKTDQEILERRDNEKQLISTQTCDRLIGLVKHIKQLVENDSKASEEAAQSLTSCTHLFEIQLKQLNIYHQLSEQITIKHDRQQKMANFDSAVQQLTKSV